MRKLITLSAIIVYILVSCKQEVYYEITTKVQPDGAGTIVLTPNSSQVLEGASVTFQANPSGDYIFTGWSGSISGTENPKSVTVSSNLNVVANFTLKTYPLTVSVEGEGTVNERVISTRTDYSSGTVVELTAVPAEHWLFDHWEGDLTGSDNPAKIIVSSSKSVKAVFVEKMYPLTVEVEGNGAVSEKVISSKSGSYQEGTVVELSAYPGEHWLFDHWEGDIEGNDNPAQITILGSKQVKAVFVSKDYELIINVKGGGKVIEKVIDTKTEYQEGTTVELTAESDEFWVFDHWEGELEGKDNPIYVTVTKTTEITAVFVENDPGIVFTETEYISPYEINRRLGLGWCFGCQLDSFVIGDTVVADEESWGNPKCTQQLFYAAASAGIKSVRIQICWLGKVGPAPDYIIDNTWLNRVEEVVNYAENAGMNVIINMQNDDRTNFWGDDEWTMLEISHRNEFWLDPERAALDPAYDKVVNERIHAMWTQIARRFRNKGDFLMFEPMNEPGSVFFWEWSTVEEKDAHQKEFDCLNEWNQTFVNAVRATGGNNASRWLVVVGAAAKERHFDRLVIPQDYVSNNRIMVALHFYEPESYCQGESHQWGHTAFDLNEDARRFDEEYVAQAFRSYKEKYMDKGIPLCVNEIGAKNRDNENDKKYHLYYLEYVFRAATLNGIAGYIYDQGGNDPHDTSFAIFNHATGEFLSYGEETMRVVNRAVTSTDPDYTLEYIYNHAPQVYPKDPAVIPDVAFRSFLLTNYDNNHDGYLTTDELVRVQNLNVASLDIQSLSGLNYFPYLTSLNCGRNLLTELDLSTCLRLEYLNCEYNPGLTHLDVSMLPGLKYLNVQDCNIEYFDVSRNPLLVTYQVNSNPFYRIPDLSNNTHLEQIHMNKESGAYYIPADFFCDFPQLRGVSFGGYGKESIDLSKNVLLESIWAHDMPEVTKLDLRNAPNLNYLFVPNCPKLKTILVHPDVNLEALTVVKGEHTVVTH